MIVNQTAGGEGIKNLIKSITFAGNSASNLSSRIWAAGSSSEGDVLLVLQGANSSLYENISFNLAEAPVGVSLIGGYNSGWSAGNPVGNMYGCIISGLSQPAYIEMDVNTSNSSYDYYMVNLKVSYKNPNLPVIITIENYVWDTLNFTIDGKALTALDYTSYFNCMSGSIIDFTTCMYSWSNIMPFSSVTPSGDDAFIVNDNVTFLFDNT